MVSRPAGARITWQKFAETVVIGVGRDGRIEAHAIPGQQVGHARRMDAQRQDHPVLAADTHRKSRSALRAVTERWALGHRHRPVPARA